MITRFPALARRVAEPWLAPADRFSKDRVRLGHDRDFDGQVLVHEARLLLLLDKLLQLVGVHNADESIQLPAEHVQPLVRANVADAVGTARAYQVMQLVRERLGAEDLPQPAWKPEVGFSNGQPLLAIFWEKRDEIIVGWQYQGRHWRLAMILTGDGLKGRGLHEARAISLANTPTTSTSA